jgi:RNA-directed DNA polymerase
MARVAHNDGAAGVDGQRCSDYLADDESWNRWRDALLEELRTKRYRPSPVRRVWIEKDGGKKRPLGIPTVKDRVVQTALVILLLPIWEADSHPHSYAYRPKRRAHDAMDAIGQAVRSGRVEVIDADLSGYFDSIPHAALLRLVARRVSDGAVLALIRAWLKAPIVENDEQGRPKPPQANRQGTPQGGVISPLLANLYLNRLDWAVNENCRGGAARRPVMVRYADDFVILSAPGESAGLLERLKGWLGKAGLKLNETKTRMVDIRLESIAFLGFALNWRRGRSGRNYLHTQPSAKSQQKLRTRVREILNWHTLWRGEEEVVADLNRVLKGWSGYFHYQNSTQVFGKLRWFIAGKMRRWLWRKRGSKGTPWSDSRVAKDAVLYERLGLFVLPTQAGWCAARAGRRSDATNCHRKAGCGKTARPV